MRCGKGTYVRSIARDLGQDLGCFGHICHLERTQVGPFSIKDTISLELFDQIGHNTDTNDFLLPSFTTKY